MKIHTTQNLNSQVHSNSTNIVTNPTEFRSNFLAIKNHSAAMLNGSISKDAISFKGKKPTPEEIKKIIEAAKKAVGDIAKEANPETKRIDKFLKSKFVNRILNVVDYETMVQATIAAVACVARAGTIMAMSNEENKGNNTYATVHALASGIVGFITVFALTTPFKAGADHVTKNLFKDLKTDTLKRLHPQLDLKSIVDKKGNRLPVDQWKDLSGNKFIQNIKNCDMLPEFKQLADVSQETFEKILGVKNVDWAAQKGKSFNEVVNKDGKKLYELIDFSKLGLKVSHVEKSTKTGKEVKTQGQILLKDLNREYLQDLINKADDTSAWKKLDINSVFKDGKIQDFKKWKEISTGKQWLLDMDSVFVASELETANYAPRISGKLRFDEAEGVHKYRIYQRNGKDGGLGTEISDAMLKADKDNAGLLKSLTWAPDLVFRIPIATVTISLIPWLLKNLFHIEKKKPVQSQPVENKQPVIENNTAKNLQPAFKGSSTSQVEIIAPEALAFKGMEKTTNVQRESNNIAFKRSIEPKPTGLKKAFQWIKKQLNKALGWIGESMGKLYGRPLIESETMAKISAKLADIPGGLTQAMSTFGALLTSGTYVARTINNKNLDQDKRRTLAINQVLCFIVPTIAAYSVDKWINSKVKKMEYRYSGLQQQTAAAEMLKGNKKGAEKILEGLNKKVTGVRTLASLAVFTIIYRYATPVIITPIANWIGDRINAKKTAKKEEAKKVAA